MKAKMTDGQMVGILTRENDALRAQLAEACERLHQALTERDHYQHLVQQRYHVHDDLYAALPSVDREADGDTQVQQATAEIAQLRQMARRTPAVGVAEVMAYESGYAAGIDAAGNALIDEEGRNKACNPAERLNRSGA
jgi:hypothetical protein